MNKLVLATAVASALFGASYGATGAIESQNIVGYAQDGLISGSKMLTPQFLGMGQSALSLQSLKATGDSTSDNVSIQTLDSFGNAVDTYIWCDWAGDESDQKAWSDGSGAIIEGVTFEPGQGLWVQGSSDGQGLVSAGQVGTDDLLIKLCNGATAAGNTFPTPVNLQDILPSGDSTSDNVSIQTLDSFGNAVDTYIWCDWAGDEGDQEAWSDGSGAIIEGVTFEPGQGLWVQGSSDRQSITIPAPAL